VAVELTRVRHRGWAEAINEREIGIASIAAPVRDVTARCRRDKHRRPAGRCSVTALRKAGADDRRGGRGGVAPARGGLVK